MQPLEEVPETRKKGKRPAFQFYAADFMTDTSGMSAIEVGIYMRLLCYQWINGKLPIDMERLSRITGVTVEEFEKAWDELQQKFIVKFGWMYNQKMENIRNTTEKWIEKQKINGELGGISSVISKRKKKIKLLKHSEVLSTRLKNIQALDLKNVKPESSSSSSSSSSISSSILNKDNLLPTVINSGVSENLPPPQKEIPYASLLPEEKEKDSAKKEKEGGRWPAKPKVVDGQVKTKKETTHRPHRVYPVQVQASMLHQKMVDQYYFFMENFILKAPMPDKMPQHEAQFAALKKIRDYLGKICNGDIDRALNAWCFILAPENWKSMEPFLQKGIYPTDIYRNLLRIINHYRTINDKRTIQKTVAGDYDINAVNDLLGANNVSDDTNARDPTA